MAGYLKLLLLALLFLLAACRQSRAGGTADLTIELVAPVFPSLDGRGELQLRLLDAAGAPVNDAHVRVRGDMTHAGMVPLLAETTGGRDGLYTLPFAWSMAGDWVLTVRATLPDGAWAERPFDLTVTADEICE
ncbi:MAG: FixH family protein [Anaerolineales bacterium]|nr:FixH family protein [Anaerolineales bacterium]